MELILTGTWYVLVWSILVALVVGAYRWVRSQSPVLAAMLVFGIVARAAIGVALFWISYLDLSLLSEFHAGDGFWQLAPDARDYYDAAVAAYFDLPREGAQADTFAAILSGWFYWVGPSPASGLLLNVGVYVLLCVLVLAAVRAAGMQVTTLPCAAALAPFTTAPILLINASQGLKDETFGLLSAVVSLSVLALLRVRAPADGWPAGLLLVTLGGASLGLATYAMAGVRAYFVLAVALGLLLAIAVYVWQSRKGDLRRAVGVGALCLGVVFAAYVFGTGDAWWYRVIDPRIVTTATPSQVLPGEPQPQATAEPPRLTRMREMGVAVVASVLGQIEDYRAGFEQAGGATNVVPAARGERRVTEDLLSGLALVFVPITLVRGLGLADFDGGRGLLLVTDVDTLVLDLSIGLALVLLFVYRRRIGPNLPYVCYNLCVALVTTLLLAYVVTNLGTLVRLRHLMVVPFCLLPLAVCRRAEPTAAPHGARAERIA